MGTGEEREQMATNSGIRRHGGIPADTFANRLILVRAFAGYATVKDAAERCGLNYGSWSNWERGARPRDLLDVVQKISNGLGINYNWLLFGGPLLGPKGQPVQTDMNTEEYPIDRGRSAATRTTPRSHQPNRLIPTQRLHHSERAAHPVAA
jgi:transcriptional regulator with XRE-family HTH domain